ncbi:potassium/sodium hyperpolarization-activated cyclic nucleotide-gated channel 1-like [Uranotaenia lowii]|uniref:potassium/sodium hyperpolarization-activated cyclic nucleotide-gated channel 1-like n=1 Tax=Uranotaenia lowii TaxID=190385 RepID=UPI00247A4366|nr:potassium/sodium hyperpolarization-activated cyclic nucleotide-gated channel 1-like [Uranotaenia lowii]
MFSATRDSRSSRSTNRSFRSYQSDRDFQTYQHVCSLKEEPHYLSNRIGNQNSWSFRFRKWFLIDSNHPGTKNYYCSSFELRSELMRQIKSDYWFVIHPFSHFRFLWDVWLMFYLYVLMLIIPGLSAFSVGQNKEYSVYCLLFAINALTSLEIIVNCFTGYSKDPYQRDIQLGLWPIFKNYLCGMLLIDILIIIPVAAIIEVFDYDNIQGFALHLIRYMTLLKLFSVRQFWNLMTMFFEGYKIDMIKCYVIRLLLVSSLFLHWCICFYKIIASVAEETAEAQDIIDAIWDEHLIYIQNLNIPVMYRYRKCFTTVLYFLIANSFGDLGLPISYYGKNLATLCITVGTLFQFYLFLELFKLVSIINSSKLKYSEVISQLDSYMNMKQFPLEMKNRLMFFYKKKFDKLFFAEDQVAETLSIILRNQISDINAARFYRKVELFAEVPRYTLLQLIHNMDKEIYMPNDIIMKAGTDGSSMCFIHTGSVAVYTQSGKEISHLYDGDHFGEISLFLKSKRQINVIAIEFTQIFVLRRKVFNDLIPADHILYKRLERVAKERTQMTMLEEEQYKSHLLMADVGNLE